MNLQAKLQELKSMHDQGLISDDVYVDQQKALLTQGLGAESAAPPVRTDAELVPSTKPVPSRKASLNLWQLLVVLVILVLAGLWYESKFGTRETKDAMNQLATQTGIGALVNPWSDRAETVAGRLIAKNAVDIATAIQTIVHPTGTDPALENTSIAKLDDRIVVDVIVSWNGMVGTPYQTDVAWEINKAGHVAAKVHSDTAPSDPFTRSSRETALDDYFRTKVYPEFYTSLNH